MAKPVNEADLIAGLRKDLKAEGYSVEIRPRMDDGAGGTLMPDLMAKKAGKTLIVGVRTMGAGAEEAARMKGLAEAARAREDCEFRLVMAETREKREEASLADIKEAIADARRLFSKGDEVPALLYLWALFTGAGTKRLAAFGVEEAERQPASSFVKSLVAHGLSGQEDLAWLEEVAALRDAVAAGHVRRKVERVLFDRLGALTHQLASGLSGEIDRDSQRVR